MLQIDSIRRLALALATGGLAAGCALEVESQEQDFPTGMDGIEIQEQTTNKGASWFLDMAEGPDLPASGTGTGGGTGFDYNPPVSEYLCALAGVAGRFADQRFSDLGIAEDGQVWYPKTSTTDGVRGRVWATCTRWSNFRAPSGGGKWLSPEVRAFSYQGSQKEYLWWGDAASMLMGVRGVLVFGQVSVTQSQNPTTSSALSHFGPMALESFGRSVFAGNPSNHRLVKLRGYENGRHATGTVVSLDTSAFNVSTVSGYSGYWMTNPNYGVCYLTNLQGSFTARGDHVRIYQSGRNWYVRARSESGHGISGQARCMAYDQR